MKHLIKLIALSAVFALAAASCGGDDSDTDSAPETTAPAADAADGNDDADTEDADTEDADTEDGAMEDDSEMSDTGLPVIDPLSVEAGDVAIAGSSTVFPLSTAVLSQWIDEGGPEYSIDSIGSGGGFERFCVEGASDIANASRPIKDEELAACTDTWGDEPIEIRVGTDALSVVVSTGNYFASDLTIEELNTAFALAEPGATWADVNPDFPAHPIVLYSPGEDSGTFDYFNEVVFDEAEPSPISSSIAEIVGEDDNVTVRGVADDGCTEGDLSTTCAVGYFGYAFFQQNAGELVAVSVDGVEPNADTVDAAEYPLARPLYMYTASSIVAEKPQVAQFVAYYLNNVNDVIGEVGYFPAPADALRTAADNISTAAGF